MTLQELVAQLDALTQALKVAVAGPVTTSDGLVAALLRGGSIVLAPGTYTGNFVITQPTALSGPRGAILVPADRLRPTLTVLASDVTVRGGFTIRNGAPDRECVVVGAIDAVTVAQQPANVVLTELRIEAGAQGGHRGVALHGRNLTLSNSWVTGFWEAGRDAQAVWMLNGPGPYTIEGNFLEGSGETILVGGDTIKIPQCVPSDIVIRGNTCYKPDTWRTNGATVKNCIEIKVGRRVLIENNECNGNWASGQTGTPILLTTRNQNGDTPWVVIDEVIVRGNRTVRCLNGYAVSILGRDDGGKMSGQTQRITIESNLFSDSPAGFLIGNGVAVDLTIRHNTLPAITGTFLAFYDEQTPPRVKTPLTFMDNVVAQGEYGMNAGDYPFPFAPIVTFQTFTGNLIERHPARQIAVPAGNTWVTGLAALLDPLTRKLRSGTAGI